MVGSFIWKLFRPGLGLAPPFCQCPFFVSFPLLSTRGGGGGRIIPSSIRSLNFSLICAVMVLDQYRAVSDYTKSARNELSFKAGDIFEVIEKNDNGAFLGAPPLNSIVCELRR